jgi:hypothetical protein
MWRRLKLIAVEDVGMGAPMAPVLLEVLHGNVKAVAGGDTMMAVHAVRLMATAKKDRTSSDTAWTQPTTPIGSSWSRSARAVETS